MAAADAQRRREVASIGGLAGGRGRKGGAISAGALQTAERERRRVEELAVVAERRARLAAALIEAPDRPLRELERLLGVPARTLGRDLAALGLTRTPE